MQKTTTQNAAIQLKHIHKSTFDIELTAPQL